MGIFNNNNKEKRDYNPGAYSSSDYIMAFPNGTIPAGSLGYTDYLALRNSDVFIACSTIAKDVSRLDVKVSKKGIIQEGDRLENLINNRPNDIYNGYSLKFTTMLSALLTGVGYILIERVNGQPQSLYHIPTSRIQLKQNKKGDYYYEMNNNGQTEHVNFKDVIAIKPFTEDGLNPLNILDSLKDDMATNDYSKKFFKNYFANGTQAGSVLKLRQGKLSPEARQKIKDEWQKANSGDNGVNGTVVLDETMDFSKLEVNVDILKLITDNKSSTVQIAAAFGLPISKFGLTNPNASVTDLENQYLFSTLSNYMKAITAELDFKLITQSDSYTKKLVFDDTSYRRINWDKYVETLLRELDKGAISLDEYREATGREKYPDGLGEMPRVDLNHVSLDHANLYVTDDNNQQANIVESVDPPKGGEIENE